MASITETAATCHGAAAESTAGPAPSGRLVLVGNPNVGKSVIFGFLTGRYVTVSNYPGTTVTLTGDAPATASIWTGGPKRTGTPAPRRRGRRRGAHAEDPAPRGHGRRDGHGRGRHASSLEVIDTPGVNSLIPMSEDERVTRDVLLEAPAEAVIQVADAKNLRRSLLISSQLAEMGIPFALDLNMTDEAGNLGVEVDEKALAEALGIDVVRTVAVRRKGFDDLRRSLHAQRRARLEVAYPRPVEAAIAEMAPHLPECHITKRSLAVMVLSGDESLTPWLRDRTSEASVQALEAIRLRAASRSPQPLGLVVNAARLQAVDRMVERVEVRPRRRQGSILEPWATSPCTRSGGSRCFWPCSSACTSSWGSWARGPWSTSWRPRSSGTTSAPGPSTPPTSSFVSRTSTWWTNGVILPDYTVTAAHLAWWQTGLKFLHDLLVGPYGQVTMALSYAIALILPIVATFFIAFGLLEDSGYLPRLAVMVNRIFRIMGLNGKAVLPMVLGLGCDTMATLTTRILETKKERILVTLLLALGVPCSAQLGVILGMIRALSLGATLVWGGSIVLTLFAVGWLAARLVPGQSSDFILELPPIRRPQLSNIVVKTLARIEWYMREAVPLFLLGTLILFAADAFHVLGVVERVSAPVVHGVLGLPPQAAQAFLIGFLRRDYGAAGLYDLSRQGLLDPVQLIVSMVTITLFVPCIANFFIMIKEQGIRTAMAMVAFIVPMAFLVGGALNWGLHALGVTF